MPCSHSLLYSVYMMNLLEIIHTYLLLVFVIVVISSFSIPDFESLRWITFLLIFIITNFWVSIFVCSLLCFYFLSLTDWLQSRRHISQDWHKSLLVVRSRKTKAIQLSIEHSCNIPFLPDLREGIRVKHYSDNFINVLLLQTLD